MPHGELDSGHIRPNQSRIDPERVGYRLGMSSRTTYIAGQTNLFSMKIPVRLNNLVCFNIWCFKTEEKVKMTRNLVFYCILTIFLRILDKTIFGAHYSLIVPQNVWSLSLKMSGMHF